MLTATPALGSARIVKFRMPCKERDVEERSIRIDKLKEHLQCQIVFIVSEVL